MSNKTITSSRGNVIPIRSLRDAAVPLETARASGFYSRDKVLQYISALTDIATDPDAPRRFRKKAQHSLKKARAFKKPK